MITLRFDPLQIFKTSKTPIGLYARANWLDEGCGCVWQGDSSETVAYLTARQAPDGSWGQSPAETIRSLHTLYLAASEKTENIGQALEWLIKNTLTHLLPEALDEELRPESFRELPFIKAHDPLTLVCATLYLACMFGLENKEAIPEHYEIIIRWLEDHEERNDIAADKSNILRALAVHRVYAEDAAVIRLVAELGECQKTSGLWPAPTPFFLPLNTLARLNCEMAHRQWLKAVPLLETTQKKDGSWGLHDREWNTFLVVDALKNKNCL